MSCSAFLRAEGLLDWPTALVGFRRGWMTAVDVSEFAVAVILDENQAPSHELVELTGAEALSTVDVEDHLVALANRSRATDEVVATRRWLFARMTEVDRSGAIEVTKLAWLQGIYAEFGFPEELRYVSPYNLTSDERDADLKVGSVASSPSEAFQNALSELRDSLLPTDNGADG